MERPTNEDVAVMVTTLESCLSYLDQPGMSGVVSVAKTLEGAVEEAALTPFELRTTANVLTWLAARLNTEAAVQLAKLFESSESGVSQEARIG